MNALKLTSPLLFALLTACGGSSSEPTQPKVPEEPNVPYEPKSLEYTFLINSNYGLTFVNTEARILIHAEDGSIREVLEADSEGKIVYQTEDNRLTYTIIPFQSLSQQIQTFVQAPVTSATHTAQNTPESFGISVAVTSEQATEFSGLLNNQEVIGLEIDTDYSWLGSTLYREMPVNEEISGWFTAPLLDGSGIAYSHGNWSPNTLGHFEIQLDKEAKNAHIATTMVEQFYLYQSNSEGAFETIYRHDASNSETLFYPNTQGEDGYRHRCIQSFASRTYAVSEGLNQWASPSHCQDLENAFSVDSIHTTILSDSIEFDYDGTLVANGLSTYLQYISRAENSYSLSWEIHSPAGRSVPRFELPEELTQVVNAIEHTDPSLTRDDYNSGLAARVTLSTCPRAVDSDEDYEGFIKAYQFAEGPISYLLGKQQPQTFEYHCLKLMDSYYQP